MNYFPIYLDAAAMHPVLPCARDAFLRAPFGNPSSEHQIGHEARNALEHAREKIAKCINAAPEQIVFTSGSTESCALGLYQLGERALWNTPSPYEHHAVSENLYGSWEGKPRGYIQQLANNEVGEIYPMPEKKAMEAIFCDATTAMGHTQIDVVSINVDYLAAGAHKFGGVLGAGLLFAKGMECAPLIKGGGQERGMRSGTENVPAICAMAAALEWQTEHMEQNTEKLSKLSEIMQTELSKIDGQLWNTPLDRPHLPHILNVSFDGVDAHALALALSKDGVMVSPGAACSNGLNEPSHVIMSMFHDEQRARSAIRISMSHQNTEEEIRIAAEKIKNAVAYLRSIG